MKERIIKLSSIVLCIAIIIANVSVIASAKTEYTVSYCSTGVVKNPVYEDLDIHVFPNDLSEPKTYRSSSQDGYFDVELCTDRVEEVISEIRGNMVNRVTEVEIYYKDEEIYNNEESIKNLINGWLELALAETENPDEGDYLRYVYGGYVAGIRTLGWEGRPERFHRITITFSYYTTRAEENRLDARIDEVVDDFGFTDETSVKERSDAIYSFITENVTYDHEHLGNNDYKHQFTAYAALMKGTAVCQGYATLLYRLARECGLNVRVIAGQSHGEGHAWNIVEIYNNVYYYVDSTWDEGGKTNYYLKGTSNFAREHTPDPQFLTSEFMEKYPIPADDYTDSEMQGLIDGDFEYRVSDNRAIVTKYKGQAKDLVIPSSLGGYPVHRLDQYVIEYDDNIESLTLSEGITGMASEALFNCSKLKSIKLPSTFAFEYEQYGNVSLGGFSTVPTGLDALEEIILAEGNKNMMLSDGILYNSDMTCLIWCPAKYAKTKVEIPNTVITVVPSAFKDCVNIEEIVMPDTVKYIGYWAFSNAASLKRADIPSSCEIIGQFAYGGTKVSSIHIPASVERILSGAFGAGCDLKKITVDSNNEFFYMENGALIARDLINGEGNDVILDYETDTPTEFYTVPSQVSTIEQYAFAYADNLKKITMGTNVRHISRYAFEQCLGFTLIEFPDSITEIDTPYLYCYNLASVIIPSSVTKIDCTVGSDTDQYTIYGEEGSYAQIYANENSISFKPVSEFNPACEDGHSMKKVESEDRYQYVCENCGDKSVIHWRTTIESQVYGFTLPGSFVYNGKEHKPALASFKNDYNELKEGIDYKIVRYENNVNAGTAYIVIEGLGEYYGEGQISFPIEPLDPAELPIKLEYTAKAYDGSMKQPLVTVDGLTEFENFQVSYENNVKPGTATVKINFWGNYEGEITKTFQIYLSAPSSLSASLYGHDDVKLGWSKVNGANGYYLYYKTASAKAYSYLGKTTGTSFSKANFADNVKYDFKVVPYYLSGGKAVLSSRYKTCSVTTLRELKAPSSVTASLYGHNDVKVSWSKVAYAKGYYVYYKKSSSKSYSYLGKTGGTYLSKANLADGVKYEFKVVPYGLSGSKAILANSYKTASTYTLKKLSTPKIAKNNSKSVKVTWSNINGESGYQISKSTKKNGTSVVSTVYTTSGKTKVISASKGKGYYYKVRAFKKVGNKTVYGPWSNVKYYKYK